MARLPKSIIKKYGITKKAWSVFRGRKRKTSRTRKASPTRRKGVRRMTRKKKRSGGKSMLPKVFKWIRIGSLIAPGAWAAKHGWDSGWGWEGALDQVSQVYTGYSFINGDFSPDRLARGWGPYIMSVLTTYGIPKLAAILRRL